MKPTVVLGFIGTTLDRASGPDRWFKWRPTVAICQHDEFLISRLELLVDPRYNDLAAKVVKDVRSVSPETEVRLHSMTLKDPWDFQEVYEALFGWAQSRSFDPEREDYLVHLTTGTHVAQICWFLLNESGFVPGRLLQASPPKKEGRDKNAAGRYSIIDLDLSKYDRLATRFAQEQRATLDFLKSGIATKNVAFNQMIQQIELVALNSTAPVLLMGPTGAGKSLLASRLYDLRKQRTGLKGRLVEVNCATLRGDQAMSTLFGHKRGAFTGAQSDRPGLLREADGGLIFLDEIGELGIDEQAMLLRALEEKTFLPLGSDKPVTSDFQLIAGTNRDLRAAVAKGQFRDDLLARINLWTFTLPSLADRREDLDANIDFELARFCRQQNRQVSFNKEAHHAFLKFARSPEAKWRANFRDLNAAITRMATLAPKGRISIDGVDDEIARLQQTWQQPSDSPTDSPNRLLVLTETQRAALDPFDRVQLEYVLNICAESRTLSEAGRKLFSVSRTQRSKINDADRLKKYLARFGLDWTQLNNGT